MKRKISPLHALLLAGMGLMSPCYLFVALNTALAPWPLYDRNRTVLTALAVLCTAGLLLAMRWADRHEAFFVRHEKRVVIFAAGSPPWYPI